MAFLGWISGEVGAAFVVGVQQSLATMTRCVHFLWSPGLVVSNE